MTMAQYIANALTSAYRQILTGYQRRGLNVLSPCEERLGEVAEDLGPSGRDGYSISGWVGGKQVNAT